MVFERYEEETVIKYTDALTYNFRSPEIGIGYVMKKREFFIRTDLSYSYAEKIVENYNVGFYSEDSQGRKILSYFNFHYNYGNVGDKYYWINNTYKGKISVNYLNISMTVGAKVRPNFSLFMGWNLNTALSTKFHGSISKVVNQYRIDSIHQASGYKYYSLVGTESETMDVNKENQVFSVATDFYLTSGFNYNFAIKDYLFFVEGSGGYGILNRYYKKYLINLKVGYVFKYSTDFGE